METDYEAAPADAYNNVATLTSNTGRNDANGVWGQGFLNAVTGWGSTAANLVSSFTTRATPAANLTAPTNLQQPTNYKPWMIGGAIVAALLVLVLLFRK